ncbi:MAG TPA: hypothetical protein VGH31_02300, partial [Acidimicrobiales bacterium]
GDVILRSLPARAKAVYAGGRFVTVEQSAVQFALPNAAHRDRCAELASVVESALTQHFGTPVTLQLIVDDGRTGAADAAPPVVATPSAGGAAVEYDKGIEEVDIDDFEMDAAGQPDQAAAAEARLLEAFPGTSEVTN